MLDSIREAIGMNSNAVPSIAGSPSFGAAQTKLETIGIGVSRYGLVFVLLSIGVLKFTSGEAAGIQPLVAHSPFMSWMYSILSVQGVSNLIGTTEIAIAQMMAMHRLSPKISFLGSVGAIATFLLTTSFLFSTPAAVGWTHGFPILGEVGQFLIKDLVLLGAALWTAAEALQHAAPQRQTSSGF